jgi:hypothetical protein
MKCLVGKIVKFTATLGVSAPASHGNDIMVCLLDVSTSDGSFREHCWVKRRNGMPPKGAEIEFTSRVRQYISLDEEYNQVIKLGLSPIKNIKEIR